MYPAPKSGMADRGRQIYAANGCVYCHSQQVRADYASTDIERKWGDRRSAPRDYLFERPVVLGKMRLGPDLSNIGKRAPVEEESASPAASPTPSGPTTIQAPAASNPAPGTSPAAAPAAACRHVSGNVSSSGFGQPGCARSFSQPRSVGGHNLRGQRQAGALQRRVAPSPPLQSSQPRPGFQHAGLSFPL